MFCVTNTLGPDHRPPAPLKCAKVCKLKKKRVPHIFCLFIQKVCGTLVSNHVYFRGGGWALPLVIWSAESFDSSDLRGKSSTTVEGTDMTWFSFLTLQMFSQLVEPIKGKTTVVALLEGSLLGSRPAR